MYLRKKVANIKILFSPSRNLDKANNRSNYFFRYFLIVNQVLCTASYFSVYKSKNIIFPHISMYPLFPRVGDPRIENIPHFSTRFISHP